MSQKTGKYMSGFSSSSKLLVRKWAPFAELVLSFAKGSDSEQKPEAMLCEEVLVCVYNGVFAFCFRSLSALLVELEQAMLLMRSDLDDSLSLPQELRGRLGAANPDSLRYSLPKLEKTMKKVLSKIPAFEKHLNQLHTSCVEQLVAVCREHELMFNQNERDELAMIEGSDALLKRLDVLSLPAIESDLVFDLSAYFQVKVSIVVKNTLSRNMQKHDQNEISQKLRSLKKVFNDISKAQVEFEKEHIDPIKELVKEALVTN